MKIFLLEDDFMLHKAIKNTLLLENHEVDSFYDGLVGLQNIGSLYDLYIVDINLPNISGLEITKKIRSFKKDVKIFIISAKSDIETMKEGYENGCDDFLKKPFDVEELLLKINKIKTIETQSLSLGSDMSYILASKTLLFENNQLELTKKETIFIDILVSNLELGVSYETLIEALYPNEESGINALRSLVKRLRKKLPVDIIKTDLSGRYKIL